MMQHQQFSQVIIKFMSRKLFFALVIVSALNLLLVQTFAHEDGFEEKVWSLQKTVAIDGDPTTTSDEWNDAAQISVQTATSSAQDQNLYLKMKQDDSYLYLLLNKANGGGSKRKIMVYFDYDHNGTLGADDKAYQYAYDSSTTTQYTGSGGSWTSGATFTGWEFSPDGDFAEMKIPLSDINLNADDDIAGFGVLWCDNTTSQETIGWPDYTQDTGTNCPDLTTINPPVSTLADWGNIIRTSEIYSGVSDSPVDWSTIDDLDWWGYTYRGQEIRDWETSHDPSNGGAAVQPDDIDISSDTDSASPGEGSSVLVAFHDGGTEDGDPDTCEESRRDDTIVFAFWTDGDPHFKTGYKSRNWNVLLDIDNDGYKEFWLDLAGWYSQNGSDVLYLYYDDENRQDIAKGTIPDYTFLADSVDDDGDDTTWNCTSDSFACYRREPPDDDDRDDETSGDDYGVRFQIPIKYLDLADDGSENCSITSASTISAFYSTSASNTDPLQKDWMADFCNQSDDFSTDQPLCFGDPFTPDPEGAGGAFQLSPLGYDETVGPGTVINFPHTLTDLTPPPSNQDNDYYFLVNISGTCSSVTLYVDDDGDGYRDSTEMTTINTNGTTATALAEGGTLNFIAEVAAGSSDDCQIDIQVSDAADNGNGVFDSDDSGNYKQADDNYDVIQTESAVKINELMYDPVTGSEWLEITNTSPYYEMNVDNWTVSDGENTFQIPDIPNMPPAGAGSCSDEEDEPRLLVIFDSEPSSFSDDWTDCVYKVYVYATGTTPTAWFDNAEDDVSLCAASSCSSSTIIDYVAYGGDPGSGDANAVAAGIWTDGTYATDVTSGHSLSRFRNADLTDGYDKDLASDWYDAYAPSPGEENTPSIVINEVEIHEDAGSTVDWAELYVVEDGIAGTYGVNIGEYRLVGTGGTGTSFTYYLDTTQDPDEARYPSVTVSNGDYVIVHWGTGTDETDSYCGEYDTDGNLVNDCGSYIDLYVSASEAPTVNADEELILDTRSSDGTTISTEGQYLDAVVWDGDTGDSDSTNANASSLNGYTVNGLSVQMWNDASSAVDITPTSYTSSNTFGRDQYSSDTNATSDWDSTGGVDAVDKTLGQKNLGAVLPVTINEVLFNPVSGDNEWVELYCSETISSSAYVLDWDADTADTSTSITLSCDEEQYIRIDLTGLTELDNSSDAISLCSGASCNTSTIVDFVAYGDDPGAKDDIAVTAGIWTAGEYVGTSGMIQGDTIGRDQNQLNTNATTDWATTGGPDAIAPSPANTTASSTGQNINYPLIFNEVMFNPDSGNYEWIEIYNPNDVAVDLHNLTIQDGEGNSYTIDTSTLTDLEDIPAGEYMTIHFDDAGGAGSNDYSWDDGDYAELHIDMVSGSGNDAILEDTDVLSLCLNGSCSAANIVDFLAWGGNPGTEDDDAVTKSIWDAGDYINTGSMAIDPEESIGCDKDQTDTNQPADWEEHGGTHAIGITPGEQNIGYVVINEVSYQDSISDWIELYNPTDEAITLTDWCISLDDGGNCDATINTTLAAGSYYVVNVDLSDASGAISLYNSASSPDNTTIVDFVAYGADPGINDTDAVARGIWQNGEFVDETVSTDETIGRDKDSIDTDSPDDWNDSGGIDAIGETSGARNIGSPIINEISYLDGSSDWIELYNPLDGDLRVDLCISLDDGANCLETLNTTLTANQYLQVSLGSNALNDTSGAISLYFDSTTRDSTTIGDFAAYGADPSDNDADAVAAGIWDDGDFVDTGSMTISADESIGRDKDQTDTDQPADWEEHGGVHAIGITPNARNIGSIILNEVNYNDSGGDWVEIYNPTDTELDLDSYCLSLDDGNSCYNFPDLDNIPAGEYLIIHFGTGADDTTWSDNDVAEIYTGSGSLDNSSGAISIYNDDTSRSSTSIVDFMAYGAAPGTSNNASGSGYDAIQAGLWDSGDYVDESVDDGETIGRDQYSTDTNQPEDWDDTGGRDATSETFGARNLTVTLNEVMFNPSSGSDWVEIYCAADVSSGSANFTLNYGSTSQDITLNCSAGGYVQVTLTGDLSSAYGALSLCSYDGSGCSANTIVDFVAYGGDPDTTGDPDTLDDAAIAAGIWTDGDYVDISAVSQGESIGRDKDQTDADETADWYQHGGIDAIGETPAARNLGGPIINEISFLDGSDDWIELYNPTDGNLQVELCLSLDDGGNCLTTISTTLTANEYRQVRLSGDALNDTSGAIALYADTTTRDSSTIADFVAYGAAPASASDGDAAYDAVSAGIWDSGDYVDTSGSMSISTDESIGRDKDQTDTNQPADWEEHGGVHAVGITPNAQNIGSIIMNEISYQDGTADWVELYNPTDIALDLDDYCLSLDDGASCYDFPDTLSSIPAGEYLIVHFGTGTNDVSWSDDDIAEIYTCGNDSCGTGELDALGDSSGAISVYNNDVNRNSTTIVDFVAYGAAPDPDDDDANSAYDAIQAGLWDTGDFVNETVSADETIGRDKDSIDTNQPEDWDDSGGKHAGTETPGARNLTVILNEVMFDPSSGNDWVEIYCEYDITSGGSSNFTISDDSSSQDVSLDCSAGEYVKVELTDFSLDNASDVVSLCSYDGSACSAATIVDFVAYGGNPAGNDDIAVTAGIWTDNSYVDASGVSQGESIGRDKDQSDTDQTSDWYEHGGIDATGPTESARNLGSPIINEVSFKDSSNDWVELYNPTDGDLQVDLCISLDDGNSCIRTLSTTLSANEYRQVALSGNALNDTSGAISLYVDSTTRDSTTIGDFVAYGADPGDNDADAVTANIWDNGDFVNTGSMTIDAGESIGRDKDQTDTNQPVDWEEHGGEHATGITPNARNLGTVIINEISYLDSTNDWIELYNPSDEEVVVDLCISLDDGGSCTATVQTTLAAGAYHVVNISLADGSGAISLYMDSTTRDSTTIGDFVAYGASPGDNDADAVAAGIWSNDTFVSETMVTDETIGRDQNQTDTNSISDWDDTGGQDVTAATEAEARTPGVRNYMVLTYAVLSSFKAYSEGGQVIVEWQTASEEGTVGFYLKRLNKKSTKYVRVNKKLLSSLIISPVGGTYRYVDKHAKPGETYTYQLVEEDASGQKRVYGPFTLTVEAGDEVSLAGLITSEYSMKTRPRSREDNARRNTAKAARKKARALKKARKGTSLKIIVQEKGLYYLEASKMAEVMNVSVKSIQRWIKTKNLALSHRGQDVAWLAEKRNTGIYFYGEGIDSLYTDENVYWLKFGKALAMEVVKGRGPKPATGDATFTETQHLEEDHFFMPGAFTDPKADFWVWEFFIAGNSRYDRRNITFLSDGVASVSSTALMSVHLKGYTDMEVSPDHHVLVSLNGASLGEGRWDGREPWQLNLEFPQTLLKDGNNELEFTAVLDEGVSRSVFYVDSFDLTYQRTYQAVENTLLVTSDTRDVVTIEGFSYPDILVFDVTNPLKPGLIDATSIDQNDAGYRVSFRSVVSMGKYLAISQDASSPPLEITADVASRLKREKNAADYLVITPEELKEASQVLADYRQTLGLRTLVVNLEDIYDEFNDGISSPEAIKEFLAYTYCYWDIAPRYGVLAGKGTFDYKDKYGYGGNLIPPLLGSTPNGLFPSDNLFGDVAGDDGIPDIIIGRLPVVSLEEFSALIEKIKAYESTPGGDWKQRILMVADADMAFSSDSDKMAALLPSEYRTNKIYLSDHTIQEAQQLFRTSINEGALLLNYIGHGGITGLGGKFLRTSDVDSFMNGDRLPIMTAMTCSANHFAYPGYNSLSEMLLLKSEGGTIAAWAPTGLSFNTKANIMNQGFFQAIFEQGESVLGEIVLEALKAYAARETMPFMLNIYTLLGDPALRIQPGSYVRKSENTSGACRQGKLELDKEGKIVTQLVTVRKAGNGTGILISDIQECGIDCKVMKVPYTADGRMLLKAIPSEDSYFVGWQDRNGVRKKGSYYVQPGDVLIAVFKKKTDKQK